MEPGGRQYRENRNKAAGFTKETSLKIEQASGECVCRLAPQHTLEISLFFARDILCVHEQWSIFQPVRQIILANVYSWCASECTSRCLIDCVPGQGGF